LFGCAQLTTAAPNRLELKQGDHICIIGNTLADRMQHSGWLESLIHTRHPDLNLVLRNLGFSGDELRTRLRSKDFGTPDEWLRHAQADVVFAMFGFNESFRGPDGLPAFRRELVEFIEHTRNQDYSGRGAPRLVLFSPITQERHTDPDLPDPDRNNLNIRVYARAMEEVARERGVLFIDLFEVSEQAYGLATEPLTVNGIHLRESGYRVLAPRIYEALFGESAPTMDNGVRNRDTMLREMEMRDVMTANRDRRVWAIAQGADLEVLDDNLPEPVVVTSNKPGPNPDGSHRFLSGEEAIQHMKLAPGCRVNLFASEEQFPELINPVQMAFDTEGRLWVAAWPNYPGRTPWSTQGDSLLILEDQDGDGRADRCIPFIDDLNAPTGFQFYRDGVILVQAPDVWFVRDTDGDGRADWKERVLSGLDSADSHHTANALALDPGGAIYLSDGVFHRTQVETSWGPVRNIDAAIYRFEPNTGRFETYIAYGFANPHGRVFDRWGNDLVTDATGNNTYFGPAFSGRLDYPSKHARMRQFWDRPARPCSGTGILSSRQFPEEFQGNFLNCNVIGFQGIYRVKVEEEGSGLVGHTLEPLVESDDPNFRPTAVGVAPDGAVIFLDWHNPIIGHMQHHLRDPSRDHAHGRVYRITHLSRTQLVPPQIVGAPILGLLELLHSPEDDVRTRAKTELSQRETPEVVAVLKDWVQQFNADEIADQHALMEALWVLQWHNTVDQPLLRQMLQSPEPRARAAAVRVLCYWRDRVTEPLKLLKTAANDLAPRVRLEAVRAASFFEGRQALEVAHEILKRDTDYYLEYVFNETLRQLQPPGSAPFLPQHPLALARVLDRLDDQELMQAEAIVPVLEERLLRPGLDLNTRNDALLQLATLKNTDRVSEALVALHRLDRGHGPPTAAAGLGQLLLVLPDQVSPKREALDAMARGAKQRGVRAAAWAGLVAADGRPDAAWASTAADSEGRTALIASLDLFLDPAFRSSFGPLLIRLLADGALPPVIREASLRALPSLGADHATASYRILCKHLPQGRHRTTAARALMQIPRDVWEQQPAVDGATAILEWASQVPASDRTEQAFVETVQAGMELATLAPPEDQRRLRKGLLGLGVRVFVIKTVREAMRYDTTRIVVQAGKPFEVIFENQDMMPHNLVFVEPGAREEVGKQADRMPPTPDSQGRVYVPDNPKILASSKLLEPGSRQTLKLKAPEEPGAYEYLCTYPEHWRVMFGKMLVVPDADSLLESSLSSPSQSAPVTPSHAATAHSTH
jgi:glucose/arabinose dehydrogenase/lysophospholipase L1-like esterase/azurin